MHVIYLPMLGLKLDHVIERGHWYIISYTVDCSCKSGDCEYREPDVDVPRIVET